MKLNDLKELIESSVLAFATCSFDSQPNVIAVGFVKVISDNEILITDNFMNKTAINLKQNEKTSLAFWSKDGESGYQIKGHAQYLTSGLYKDMIDKMPENQNYGHKAAVLVTVTEIWDLANPKLVYKK